MTALSPEAKEALAGLSRPLAYACADGFARLPRVKGLSAALSRAVEVARRAGVDETLLQPLLAELDTVDAGTLPRRKAALSRVAAAMKGLGVELPAEVEPLAAAALAKAAGKGASKRSASRLGAASEGTDGASAHASASASGNGASRSAPVDATPSASGHATPSASGHASSRAASKSSAALAASGLDLPLIQLRPRPSSLLLADLERRGVQTVRQLLFLLPRTLAPPRQTGRISDLEADVAAEVEGTISQILSPPPRYGRGGPPFKLVVQDGSGSLSATFFNAPPWLRQRFQVGARVRLRGTLKVGRGGWEMVHPEVESADAEPVASAGEPLAIYPGIIPGRQRTVRALVARVLEPALATLEDPLTEEQRARLGLVSLPEALRRIHRPHAEEVSKNDDEAVELDVARTRLAFDELFLLQLALLLRKRNDARRTGIPLTLPDEALEMALGVLPFTLTAAQRTALDEVLSDLRQRSPMSRLLQGDVGSGKTAVAAVASIAVALEGAQAALMAPTEVLALQHLKNLQRWTESLGIRVALLTGSRATRSDRAATAEGEAGIVIGTHALFQEEVAFRRLALVVVDEQHRFGVLQRKALGAKGLSPHVLVMTATPIPRTLAMVSHGDLDISVIGSSPPGRGGMVTRVVGAGQRKVLTEEVAEAVKRGRQAYVIYPRVEAGEDDDRVEDVTRGAELWAKALAKALGPEVPVRVGLLHGKMPPADKERVLGELARGELHVLVATTVVEVGIDVPNATVMVIEGAERFGLSQLHQLRGRVGRGSEQGTCLLVPSPDAGGGARRRLALLERSTDGFTLAEQDLAIRGAGELLGTRQSGAPLFDVAELPRDAHLLERARAEAERLLSEDPTLERTGHAPLRSMLAARFDERLGLAEVG